MDGVQSLSDEGMNVYQGSFVSLMKPVWRLRAGDWTRKTPLNFLSLAKWERRRSKDRQALKTQGYLIFLPVHMSIVHRVARSYSLFLPSNCSCMACYLLLLFCSHPSLPIAVMRTNHDKRQHYGGRGPRPISLCNPHYFIGATDNRVRVQTATPVCHTLKNDETFLVAFY